MKHAHRIGLAAALATSALGLLTSGASAYTVTCADGTTSEAGGRQGACSHHGGVAGPRQPVPPSWPLPPPPPLPPVDTAPPTVTVAPPSGTFVGAGRPYVPPAITVADDVAWPAGSYTITITWGDGTQAPVPLPAITAAGTPVSVPLAQHVYVHGGDYDVTASVTDPAGHTTTVPVASAQISPALIAPAGFPKLVGTPRAGRTLTCRTGSWGDPDADLAIRWRADGRLIPDAADRTFRARPRDKGRRIACQVVESNDVFRASATSNALRIGSAR